MMKVLFKAVFYKPLYNGLVILIGLFGFLPAGVAIVVFTVLIKLILFPLSKKSIKTQLLMKKVEPEIAALKEKYKNDKAQQTKELLEFYKKNDINPFSGVLLMFIQLPIIIALYQVFLTGGITPIRNELLYSFVRMPEHVNTTFFWLSSITDKSHILAVIAAITQYFQIKLSAPVVTKTSEKSFSNDFSQMMQLQMKFIFPVMIYFIAYKYSAVVALYFITSSLFAIAQEFYMRRHLKIVHVK